MARAAATLEFPKKLQEQMSRYALATGLGGVQDMSDEGPASLRAQSRYSAKADYVIELSPSSLKAITSSTSDTYRFLLSVRGRLVRTADNTVIDEFAHTAATRFARVEEWTAEGGKFAQIQFNALVGTAAIVFIEEWILVYRGNTKDIASRNVPFTVAKRTPDYALRPINPPHVVRGVSLKSKFLFPGNQGPSPVPSVTPTLSWERLPDSIPADYFNGSSPRARNLVYDVRVYEARFVRVRGSSLPVVAPGNLLREQVGISSQSVQITQALADCRYYFWTMRARFELDGRPRTTEWSTGSPDLDLRWWRRDTIPAWVTNPDVALSLYPFRTPGSGCRLPLG